MKKTITLLHTSPVHIAPFKALAKRIAPEVELIQVVREDWLKQARKHGLRQSLIEEVAETVHKSKGTVICTCTSLCPAAESAGAIRIDGPMMQEASRIGGPILVVFALESTRKPTMELMNSALLAADQEAEVVPLFLGEFWPLFEAGETEAFIACITTAVRHAVADHNIACVTLAQASMAPAAERLTDLGIPVLTSPEMAFRAALDA